MGRLDGPTRKDVTMGLGEALLPEFDLELANTLKTLKRPVPALYGPSADERP